MFSRKIRSGFRPRIFGVFFLLTNFLSTPCGNAADSPPKGDRAVEYTVKVAFLYNFAKFIEWPQARRQGPLFVCLVGADPFGSLIDQIEGKTVRGRRIRLRRGEHGGDNCHVLFIGDSEAPGLGEALEHWRRRGVLTVSDIDGFARAGGMIGFVTQADNVRLEINRAAIEGQGLTISAKLLEISRIVESESEP